VDQIIKIISERLGLSESVVREAIKVLLAFVRKRTSGTKFEKMIAEIPGASALLAEIPAANLSDSAGLFSRFAGPLEDAAGALSGLRSAGLQTDQIGPFIQAFLEKSREIAGPEVVEEFLKQVPVLKGLIKF
jgi:hypothetical protein